MDNKLKFTALADNYALGRPGYAEDGIVTIGNKTIVYYGRIGDD